MIAMGRSTFGEGFFFLMKADILYADHMIKIPDTDCLIRVAEFAGHGTWTIVGFFAVSAGGKT